MKLWPCSFFLEVFQWDMGRSWTWRSRLLPKVAVSECLDFGFDYHSLCNSPLFCGNIFYVMIIQIYLIYFWFYFLNFKIYFCSQLANIILCKLKSTSVSPTCPESKFCVNGSVILHEVPLKVDWFLNWKSLENFRKLLKIENYYKILWDSSVLIII